MLEQYKKSLEFLINQKELLLNVTQNKNTDIKYMQLVTQQVYGIDKKISSYYKLIESENNTKLKIKESCISKSKKGKKYDKSLEGKLLEENHEISEDLKNDIPLNHKIIELNIK